MKMTAEEILASFKSDSSRENMQRLADENGCTMKEIGQFLKDAATPKKKPGRPKGSKALKSSSRENTLKDKEKNASTKEDSFEGIMLARKYLIPPIIKSLTQEKIEELSRLKLIHENKALELKIEIDELTDFLDGGFIDGEEEGIHREV